MRQRIVINLDQPAGEGVKPARKRRRWPRVLGVSALLVLVVVVVAALGGFLWWRHYQSTPVYSVVLLVHAAARNDVAEFQKHINEDEIARNMVTPVSQKAAARYGYALNSSIQQQIDGAVPSLLSRLKDTIRNEVQAGMAFNALAPEGRSFVYTLRKVPSLLTVKTEGDTSKVTMPRGNLQIELTMQRFPDGWKITEFKDELAVQHIVDSVIAELPAIGKIDANSPVAKESATKEIASWKTKMSNGAEQSRTFETSLEALEQIVRQLEDGDLPLEKSLELFEQGIRLSRECQERLSQAERRIEILLRDNQGRPVAAAFKEPVGEDENGL